MNPVTFVIFYYICILATEAFFVICSKVPPQLISAFKYRLNSVFLALGSKNSTWGRADERTKQQADYHQLTANSVERTQKRAERAVL